MKTFYLFITGLLIAVYGNANTTISGLRIALGNDVTSSSTHLFFSDNGTAGFDKSLDKEIHGLPANRMNYIYSLGENGQRLYVNYCPKASAYFSTRLQVSVQDTGTFSFLLETEDNTLTGLKFMLTDAATGQSTEMIPGIDRRITFTAADLNTSKDFTLHVFPAPKVTSSAVNCYGGNNGSVHASFYCNGGWETHLRNANGVLATTDLCTNDVEFAGLPAGVYFVEGWKDHIKLWEEIIAVGHPPVLAAKFTVSNDTLFPEEKLSFVNKSKGSARWYWDFGDGNTSSQYEPSHTYDKPGNYEVSLTISDGAGCISKMSIPVFVQDSDVKNVCPKRESPGDTRPAQ